MPSPENPRPSQIVIDDFGDGAVLVASRCPTCAETRYPPRVLCVNDLTPMERVPVSREGTVAASVYVSRPPFGFPEPYWVGYVDMPEGIRIFSMIASGDGSDPEPGMTARYEITVTRTEPDPVNGPVFTTQAKEEH